MLLSTKFNELLYVTLYKIILNKYCVFLKDTFAAPLLASPSEKLLLPLMKEDKYILGRVNQYCR